MFVTRSVARRCLNSCAPLRAASKSNLQDPYPLPLQTPLQRDRSKESYTPHPTDTGLQDADADINTMRSRLVYQTRKRGTLETGLLLSTFATAEQLAKMDADELRELDRLLTVPEWTLFYWATGKQEPPFDSPWRSSKILAQLVKHTRNEGGEIRAMPEL